MLQQPCGERFHSETRFADTPEEAKLVLSLVDICYSTNTTHELPQDSYHKASTTLGDQETENGQPSRGSSLDTRASNTAKQTDSISNKAQRGSNKPKGITESDQYIQTNSDDVEIITQKYMVVCFPGNNGSHIKHIPTKQEVPDTALIAKIKSEYFEQRGLWTRLSRFCGFHSIGLARVRLR